MKTTNQNKMTKTYKRIGTLLLSTTWLTVAGAQCFRNLATSFCSEPVGPPTPPECYQEHSVTPEQNTPCLLYSPPGFNDCSEQQVGFRIEWRNVHLYAAGTGPRAAEHPNDDYCANDPVVDWINVEGSGTCTTGTLGADDQCPPPS